MKLVIWRKNTRYNINITLFMREYGVCGSGVSWLKIHWWAYIRRVHKKRLEFLDQLGDFQDPSYKSKVPFNIILQLELQRFKQDFRHIFCIKLLSPMCMLQPHNSPISLPFILSFFRHLAKGTMCDYPHYEVSPTYCCLEMPVMLYLKQWMLVCKNQHQSLGAACYLRIQDGLQGVLFWRSRLQGL
jgi:hypothetical protein